MSSIGVDTTAYGTHTMGRTKAPLIYKKTKNLRAVQTLLGHSKLESTVSSAADTISVVAASANSVPVANAGNDQNVPAVTTVFLDGSGSTDADGNGQQAVARGKVKRGKTT